MHQSQPAPAATLIPNWMNVDEARQTLDDLIDDFVVRTVNRGEGSNASALALKVTAGVGKTSTTLRVIARHAKGLLSSGHVLFYMPTLALAEQAAADFRKLAPDVPCVALRGRKANDPNHPGQKMCKNHELVSKFERYVWSVTHAYCRAMQPDGSVLEAPCAAACPYLAQREISTPHVIFLSHQYLTLTPPIGSETPIALRIIDEKFWPQMQSTTGQDLDRFLGLPGRAFDPELQDRCLEIKTDIVRALRSGKPLLDFLKSNCVKPETLFRMADAERASYPAANIHPGTTDAQIDNVLRSFDREEYLAARLRASIYEMLADAKGEATNRLTLRDSKEGETTRSRLFFHSRRELCRDVPLLLLDADADPALTEAVVPGARFHAIEVKPQAEVLQISNLTMSDSALLDATKGATLRADVRAVVAAEVARHPNGKVLVVGTRRVLSAIHDDLNMPESFTLENGGEMMGAEWRWFGPKMQGLNAFEDFDTVVVIGRLQLPLQAVEDRARAIFGDDTGDLMTPYTDGALPSTTRDRLMADGSLCPAIGRDHPDARVQAILAQTRECTTLQAIARLRLASPKKKKRVVVLANMPLPGFPITRVVPFADLTGEPEPKKRAALEPALLAARAEGLKRLHLSKAGLVADLPKAFSTQQKAANFRRGLSTAELIALVRRIAAEHGWEVTEGGSSRDKGGKATPYLDFSEAMSIPQISADEDVLET